MTFTYNHFTDRRPRGAVSTDTDVTIRFPVAKDIRATNVDIVIRLIDTDVTTRYSLDKTGSDGDFDVYTVTFRIPRAGIYYYRFEVGFDDRIYFIGCDELGNALQGDWLGEWQLTVYGSDYSVPDKLHGGVVYQVFVDRFKRGAETPFIKSGKLKKWDEPLDVHVPGVDYQANDYYGGNLDGIISELPYFQSLGVTILYLSPIFEAFSNHRYDTADYEKIDELLGTEEDFDRLISEAGKLGIGIILDGVFNHTGADSKYFNRFNRYSEPGAYQRKGQYADWFTFHDDGGYDCWWGMTCVPTINKRSQSVRRYFTARDGILDKWTRHGIVGWRLDVVDELESDFLDLICSAARNAEPSTVIIGEVWEDASVKHSYGYLRPYFTQHQLDGVLNYVYKNAILGYCRGGSPVDFYRDIASLVNNYPEDCLKNCFTMLDSHDTTRALTALAGLDGGGMSEPEKRDYVMPEPLLKTALSRMRLASAIQFTLIGLPTIYYGDEIGMYGFTDPLNRHTYDWSSQNKELQRHYRRLGAIRSEYRDYFKGHFMPEYDKDLIVYYWQKDHVCYDRFDISDLWSDKEFEDRLYFVANNGKKPITIDVKGLDVYGGRYIDGCKTLHTNDFLILLRQNQYGG